jgi:DNA-binding transcriptional MocR family regulator
LPISDVVTFDGAPPEGCIHFGVGQPSPDLLPVKLLAAASEQFYRQARPLDLNYGERQGDQRFRQSLAAYLSEAYGFAVQAGELFVTGGNSQALDFICARFTRPGDTVLVEEPSYFLAFQVFRDHGLKVVGVPMDEAGMQTAALERLARQHRPALVYTIPSFHNPTGVTLGGQRRRDMAALSRELDFVLVADEVYQLLHAGQPPPPPLAACINEGRVLSLGSFSKILAPGLRLGWVQAGPELMQPLLSSGFVNSGGSLNHVSSHIVRAALDGGLLVPFVAHLRETYASRIEAMDRALRQHLAGWAQWHKPAGGYFFWLEGPPGFNAASLRGAARAAGTGFQDGAVFSADGGLTNYLRLSFAHYGEADIAAGIARLGEVVRR